MKLSEWAKRNGISYKTAWRWIKQGRFSVPYEQTPSGTILVRDTHDEGAQGRRIAVVDSGEVKDDLVQDVIGVLTSFCARLYGRRSAENKAKRALEAIQCEN